MSALLPYPDTTETKISRWGQVRLNHYLQWINPAVPGGFSK